MTDAVHAADAFRERFGTDPDGIWQAPGRVNLIGEHTDYNDGLVMPFAIDRYTRVAVGVNDDRIVRCTSAAFGDAAPLGLDELIPERTGGWAAYVHGAIAETAALVDQINGLDIYVESDVPAGAGLSSSAAIECATALAVHDLHGGNADRMALAQAAQRAEHRFARVPCGLMDQLASLFGEEHHALLIDTRSQAMERLPVSLSGVALVVIDTRVKHALAEGSYAARRRECEEAARALGVTSLRDVDEGTLREAAARMDPILFRRARHVVSENRRVLDAAEALRAGVDTTRLSGAMLGSHASLRDDFEVSSPELDLVVDVATASGASAARMTGAGFGGSAITLIPEHREAEVLEAVGRAAERAGHPLPNAITVRAAAGAVRER